jgi:hypothetical protein
MIWSSTMRFATVAALTGWAASAWALDDAAMSAPGKTAALAALSEGADVPARPPRLPELPPDNALDALANAAFGRKSETAGRTRAEGHEHAADDARAAYVDAAVQAAEASVAAAARNAIADVRAAAGQARASAAKADGNARVRGAPAAARL